MFSSRTLTDREIPDFDIREDYLEDHWGDDEARCESQHTGENASDCTTWATHRCITSCGSNRLVCSSFAEFAKGDGLCARCRKTASLCWELIPV